MHGENRLGGSSLLDCVVYGRIAAAGAMSYALKSGFVPVEGRIPHTAKPIAPVEEAEGEDDEEGAEEKGGTHEAVGSSMGISLAGLEEYSLEQVARHRTRGDMWVTINGLVLNVSDFIDAHPGGAPAIMLYAGRDATAEFNMVHPPGVVKKFAPWAVIGKLKQ